MKVKKIVFAALMTTAALIIATEPTYAENFINIPSYVEEANSENVEKSGRELMLWMGAVIGVVSTICICIAGLKFMTGDKEGGKNMTIGTLIGLCCASLGAGIIYSVVQAAQ